MTVPKSNASSPEGATPRITETIRELRSLGTMARGYHVRRVMLQAADALTLLQQQLDALRAAREGQPSLDDTLDIYVPGRWRCLTCGFVLSQVTLFMGSGEAGHTREQIMGEHRDACPNDGELMTRVTWREDAQESLDYSMRLIDDVLRATGAASLPAALDEMRAAAPEKGGQ